ncbi:serine/threonine protein kinase [Nonomuraea endophytica]|uniref:serine/threonine protein kinase n=1 Tax=Nonomuraea endophytica TaxID=714136 RepID=UPI0037C9E9A7
MTPPSVGPYRIVRKLGEGGQGVVYLGVAPDGTPVAVKVLREGGFEREIAAARRVEPFCIAQVLDASAGGTPYIVTEFVDGPSLAEAGRHSGADLDRLAVATATALAAIHRAGVVHRDFKPGNVLLGRDGPRVIDFGIARAGTSLTVTSSVVGTPAYMAPEQLAGAGVGPAADVFAWASVIVFAATGTPPFGSDTLPAIINRILHNEPRFGDLPDHLRAVVYACLAKDPAARPSMEEVLLRLLGGPPLRGTAGRPAPATAPAPEGAWAVAGDVSPRRRGRSGPRRIRVPVLAGAAVATALVLTAGTAVVWKVTLAGQPTTLALQPGSGEVSKSGKGRTRKPSDGPTTGRPGDSRGGKTREPGDGPTRAGTPATKTGRPTPTRTPARPTTTRTPARPTATRTPARPSPTRSTPTRTPTKRPTPTKTARFTVAYVRSQGASKIKDEGTCYVGSMNFGAGIDSTVPGSRYSFQWIVDGEVIEAGSGKLPNGSRSDYVFSKRQLSLSDGPHTAAYRVVGGGSASVSFKMCATS